MADEEIKNLYFSHAKVWSLLSKINKSKKLVQLIFFQVPQGSGKEAISIKFAQLINCEQQLEYPCDSCASCKRFSRLQHENLNIILPLPTPNNSKNPKNFIDKKIAEIISNEISFKAKDLFHKIKIPRANRILIQSIRNLRSSIYLKSLTSGRKVVLFFDAHILSRGQGESANSLLKLLEEPPNRTTFILVTDKPNSLFSTIRSRCLEVKIQKFDQNFIIKWLKLKNIKESHLLLIAGLSDGNIHHAKFLISQSFEKFLLLLGETINIITNKNSEEWRTFVLHYSKMITQDIELFYFHFSMLKIWFQSLNRLKMNLVHLLHETALRKGMDNVNKKFPNADFFEIVFEIERTRVAPMSQIYMPLELTNFLIRVKKHLEK